MKSTLYTKLIIAYLIFWILNFAYIYFFAIPSSHIWVEKNQAADIYEEAVSIADTYGNNFYSNRITYEALHTTLDAVDSYLSATIWIMSSDGQLLLSSTEPTPPERTISDFNPTDSGSDNYMTGDFYGSFDKKMISVISPITSNFKTRGYVVIHAPYDSIEEMQTIASQTFYKGLAVTFILSLIIMVFFAKYIFIPMKKIKKATKEYAKGNMDYRIPLDSHDEIGQLAYSLNYMSDEISKGDDFQKKFVANVSHDFRSPLTSIKGYAQAMMDGTIEPEQYEKYLNIIASEAERLQTLTESILTLNRYDSNSLVIEKSDFDVNNIIRDTAALFEGKCRPKKISIELVLLGNELMVHADKAKIQQVIYNLVDNAIKFSHSNSSITVETSEKNDKIFVSVKDSGIGIPKDSLSEVWNRFYKTDLSRGKDKKGSGLGLSITREIIYAHSETIDVISTEGVGSQFIFSLEKAKSKGWDLL